MAAHPQDSDEAVGKRRGKAVPVSGGKQKKRKIPAFRSASGGGVEEAGDNVEKLNGGSSGASDGAITQKNPREQPPRRRRVKYNRAGTFVRRPVRLESLPLPLPLLKRFGIWFFFSNTPYLASGFCS